MVFLLRLFIGKFCKTCQFNMNCWLWKREHLNQFRFYKGISSLELNQCGPPEFLLTYVEAFLCDQRVAMPILVMSPGRPSTPPHTKNCLCRVRRNPPPPPPIWNVTLGTGKGKYWPIPHMFLLEKTWNSELGLPASDPMTQVWNQRRRYPTVVGRLEL